MKRVKQYLLLFFILFLPQVLSAWGDGERASNGGCKFDKEMGFSGSTLYTKGDEAYIIVDMTDSRYGTTSTVYNAKTCEKVTSGNKVDSNFENLMEKRGFSLSTVSTNSSTLDQNFENKISFAENSDTVAVKLDTIDKATTEELNQIISNLSNKSASSQIYISQPLKELLSYTSIYEKITNRINSLSDEKINYSYALALMDKLKSLNIKINYSSNTLITRKENLEKRILAEQERLETELADKLFSSSVQSIKDVPNWMNKMVQTGRENRISNYIPQILKLKDFGKSLTPNNFLSSIEYKYILKDLKLNSVSKIENNDKYYGLELSYPNKTIDLTRKPTCKDTGRTSTSEFSCGFFWMNTCVGTYAEYKCKGDTSAIAKVERTLKGTTKIARELNKGWTYEPMISRYTKSTPNYSSSSSNTDSSSMTSSSSISRSSSSTVATSSSKKKQKGVKKIYAHGKGGHGQTYYAIICTQDRSRHGNWQRKDGIWMSFGTMAGHRNQSLSEYAQDFCK